jgi:SSS family solute:Na+ symporter
VYIVGITAFGIYVGRRIKTTGEFLLAGRGVHAFLLAGSTLATIIGTGATIGASGYAYQNGFAGALYGLGQGLGIIIVGLAFAKMRKYEFMSLGEEIACYYGGNRYIYEFANVMMFLSLVCWMGVQIMGAANYLGILTGLPYITSVITSGITFGFLVIIGGYVAVVYTDVVQAFIFFFGFVALAVVGVIAAGGISTITNSVPAENWSFLGHERVGWFSVIGIPMALMISYIAEPGYRHRIYSARSVSHARWSMITPGLIAIPFSIFTAVLGMAAFSLNPELTNPDETLPWLATQVFPVWAMALILISGFAATFSSANSDCASGTLFFIRHIYNLVVPGKRYPENTLLASRITVAVMMTAATLLVLMFKSIVNFIVLFISVLMSGLATVILLGRFWKRATWQGAVTAIIVGAVASLAVEQVPAWKDFWQETIIPATLSALVAHVIVSLFTFEEKPSFEEVAKQMAEEREELETVDETNFLTDPSEDIEGL